MKKILVFLFAVFFVCFSTSAMATTVSVTSDVFTDGRYPDQISPQNYPNGMHLWGGQQECDYTFLKFGISEGILSSDSELNIYCNYVFGDYDTTTKIWYFADVWDDDTIIYNNMQDFWLNTDFLDQQYSDGSLSFSDNNVDVRSTPEPTTIFLLGFGLIGIAGIRKIKK